MGQGTKVRNITYNIDETMDGLYLLKMEDVINNSPEFIEMAGKYSVYKIESMMVSLYPNDELNNSPTYQLLDWATSLQEQNAILLADNARIMFNDAKSVQFYPYIPPNCRLINFHGQLVNPTEFNYITIKSPGVLYFRQNGNKTLRGRIDIRVVFKMPVPSAVQNVAKLTKIENDLINKIFDMALLKEQKNGDQFMKEMREKNEEIEKIKEAIVDVVPFTKIEENMVEQKPISINPEKFERNEPNKEKIDLKIKAIKKDRREEAEVRDLDKIQHELNVELQPTATEQTFRTLVDQISELTQIVKMMQKSKAEKRPDDSFEYEEEESMHEGEKG
jgi:hypothetical protein